MIQKYYKTRSLLVFVNVPERALHLVLHPNLLCLSDGFVSLLESGGPTIDLFLNLRNVSFPAWVIQKPRSNTEES